MVQTGFFTQNTSYSLDLIMFEPTNLLNANYELHKRVITLSLEHSNITLPAQVNHNERGCLSVVHNWPQKHPRLHLNNFDMNTEKNL